MTLQEIAAAIKQAKNVLALTHVSPDPDAIGSSGALVLALNSIGIKAKLLLEAEPEYKIRELAKTIPIIYELQKAESFDLVVGLDTSTKKRLAGYQDGLVKADGKIINIDHHVSSEISWATMNFVSDKYPAASAIVFEILNLLEVKIDSVMANLLLAGLMDDTGSFRFSNTNEIAFNTALGLLRCGANSELVSNNLYYSIPQRILNLTSICLSDMRYFAEGRGSLIFLTRELLEELGAQDGDTDVLPDIGRSAAGVIVSVIIRPGMREKGKWKISLRSKERRIDVNKIAAKFGGGGHIQASAFVYQGNEIARIESALLDEITRWLDLL
ncbi:MAG: DHH family phosphoesterase [Deltaproteobacteria bacterium]|jgi:phosphoesterase RecJ-like protein|nr:DHH family phosphoesterase [Deltaproteobacteria bacterium]